MNTHGEHDAHEAHAALEQIAGTRRAAARATRRSPWADLVLAVVCAAAVTLALLGQWLPGALVWVEL